MNREEVIDEAWEWAWFLAAIVGIVCATAMACALAVHLCITYISWLWS